MSTLSLPPNSFSGIEPFSFSPMQATPEQELKSAFENLDFNRVFQLVEEGTNPNLSIHLSNPIIHRYLEIHEPLFQGSIDLATEEDVKLFMQQFFKENSTHPILFVAALLKEEPLAELLLRKGANSTIELADPEGSKINILQIASALNFPDLARFAIVNCGIEVTLPEVEGDMSPLVIAIVAGEYEMVKLFLELKAEEVDSSIYEDEYVKQFLESSEKGTLIKALLEDYGITKKQGTLKEFG